MVELNTFKLSEFQLNIANVIINRKILSIAMDRRQYKLHFTCCSSDGPRSVINKVLPSAIGSVPLPPEKNLTSPVTPSIKAIPPPPSPTIVAGSRPPLASELDSIKSPPQASQPPAKQLVPNAPVPIGAKPMVVPGRPAPLQPVGRGVAAAFSDKDDEHYEAPNSGRMQLPLPSSLVTSDKLPPQQMVDRSKGLPPLSLERTLDKVSGLGADRSGSTRLQPPPEADRGASRDRTSVVAPKVSSLPRQPSSGDKPPGRASQPPLGKDIPKTSQSMDRGQARNQAPDGDRSSMRVTSNVERVPVKAMLPVPDRGRAGRGSSSQMATQPGGKSSLRPGEGFGNRGAGDGRGGPAPSDRPKVDPALKRRYIHDRYICCCCFSNDGFRMIVCHWAFCREWPPLYILSGTLLASTLENYVFLPGARLFK